MSLEFLDICELLEQLSSSKSLESRELILHEWFAQHKNNIQRRGAPALALLSCLLPEKRADRVYGLRPQQLERMVVKAACLGHTRVAELRRLQSRDRMDFASAAQQVLSVTDDISRPPRSLTVEEVDQTLDRLASVCSFSSPKLRQSVTVGYTDVFDELVHVLRRLPGWGVKWMIRLLLKNIRPVEMPVTTALRAFHFLMPDLLKVRTSLSDAIQLLEGDVISQLPASPPLTLVENLKELTCAEIAPSIGSMVGLQEFHKARSIQHCAQLAGHKEVSVERKYDGEYCQIHVSRGHSEDHITIFSKSGRDSTADRAGVHSAIRRCLRLGRTSCRFARQCVLVGELLVWNRREGQIMPFYKIRRYVSRAGRQLGCARDSPPCEDEHLMIVFHDVLLLDNVLCLHEPLHIRRRRLESLIVRQPGEAEIAERVEIDFRNAAGVNELRNQMKLAITRGWEGLVVKQWNAPYLSFNGGIPQIKLKKDYIPGWGDSADLVVVGGRYDATEALTLHDHVFSWTTFYLACLIDKDAFIQPDTKPRFRVVGTVRRPCLRMADLRYLNDHGKLCQVPFGQRPAGFDVEVSLPPSDWPTELFTDPAVVEVVGAGFDRPFNERFLILRFPRIQKIHHDRKFTDCLDFAEYQHLALQSATHPEESNDPHQKEKKFGVSEASQPASAPTPLSSPKGHSRKPGSGADATLDPRIDGVSTLQKKRKRSLDSESPLPVVRKKMKKTTTASNKSGEGSTATCSPSTIHTVVSDVKGRNKRRCRMSYSSQVHRSNRKTSPAQPDIPPHECSSRPTPPRIPSPLLCDKSLRNLFDDPCRDLARRFGYPLAGITSDETVFLDRVNRRMTNTAGNEDRSAIPCMVLVHWPCTTDVFTGMKSWLSRLEGCRSFLSQPGAGEISFLDWEALEAFTSLPQDIVSVIEEFSRGSIKSTD